MPAPSSEPLQASVWAALMTTGLLINFEPARLSMIGFLLTKRRAVQWLVAFLSFGLVLNLIAGLLVFFALHRISLSLPAQALEQARQLLAALFIFLGISLCFSPSWLLKLGSVQRGVDGRSRRILPISPMAAMLIMSLPSFEYLTLVSLIQESFPSAVERLAALLGFLLLSNVVFVAPILACVLFPASAHGIADISASVPRWFRERFTGCLLILLGAVLWGADLLG